MAGMKGVGRRRVWFWGLVLLIIAPTLEYWLYPSFVSPSGKVANRGDNAIWLRYTWYFGMYADRDLEALANRMRAHGIREAFFHVRGIDPRGKLMFPYLAKAKSLNSSFHRLAPGVKRIAWIYAGNRRGGGAVRLASPEVRHAMAVTAAELVTVGGFDGVQWDYEICPDGDADFLRLLDETRAELPKGAALEAAAPTWYPPPFGSQGWSEAYYREVAKRCDGLAVMGYDSATYSPRAYVWWIAQQTMRITRAAGKANPNCGVWMGLPTYQDSTISHNPRAENLRLGLIGVREGLENADLSVWRGIAIFADYTSTDRDWRDFDALWPKANRFSPLKKLTQPSETPRPTIRP